MTILPYHPSFHQTALGQAPYFLLLKPNTCLLITYHHSLHPLTLREIQYLVKPHLTDLLIPYPQSSNQTIHFLLQLNQPMTMIGL